MQGAGNDYVYVDCLSEAVPLDQLAQLAIRVSDRHFGIGGDGLVLILPSDCADVQMRIFNADGSEGEMCGNAIRCVGKYIYDHQLCLTAQQTTKELTVETKGGIKRLELQINAGKVEQVRVDMGEPIFQPGLIPTLLRNQTTLETQVGTLTGSNTSIENQSIVNLPFDLDGREIRVTSISMGNPHLVTFDFPLTNAVVHGIGPRLENDPHFPNRVNVEFVEVLSPQRLKMRVWERGSGETLACGTGACAAAIAAMLVKGCDRKVQVQLLGGTLEIEWSELDNHVYKTGPAIEVFNGEIEV